MSRRGTTNPGHFAPPRQPWCSLTIALALLLGGAASANAQMGGAQMGGAQMGGGPMGSMHGTRQNSQRHATQQPAAPPAPRAVPEPWPRLDTGAILCRTRDDLVSHQMRIAAGPSGAAAGPAADCRIIQQPTGIEILDRDGLSRTHVALTDDTKQTGWTDTYLPSTAPPSAATAASAGK